MLTVERLDVAYGGSQVLWGVDLRVAPGEVLCLMGRNGVGKTTLLKAVMGLLPVRGGRVTFDGADITRWPSDRRARAGIGYVALGREILPHLTVHVYLKVARLGHPVLRQVAAVCDFARTAAHLFHGDVHGEPEAMLRAYARDHLRDDDG